MHFALYIECFAFFWIQLYILCVLTITFSQGDTSEGAYLSICMDTLPFNCIVFHVFCDQQRL